MLWSSGAPTVKGLSNLCHFAYLTANDLEFNLAEAQAHFARRKPDGGSPCLTGTRVSGRIALSSNEISSLNQVEEAKHSGK